MAEHHKVLIVGAGFSGLGAGVRLHQSGERDFVILERGEEVGGTWWFNRYPGCQCDVPSHLYSFSFAPNPEWSRMFSPASEIGNYLKKVSEDFGLRPHLRLGTTVTGAAWNEAARLWEVDTDAGPFTAKYLVAGIGALSEPMTPDVPGRERFQGAQFHSSRWDHEHKLAGERVAVIGTGASAIQIVPEIQPEVEQLDVYQRTAPWIMPHPDRPVTERERRLYRRLPILQKLVRGAIYAGRETFVLGFSSNPRLMRAAERIALRHLAKQVPDPALRARLTPGFELGCKRVLLSNKWYPALQEHNVDLVTDGIAEIREHSIVTTDGVERPTDTIVWSTGFHVTDHPANKEVRGRGGRTFADVWSDGMSAHLGTMIAGFPNLFFLMGPNTGLGHTSMVFMIESQIMLMMKALGEAERRGAATVEVRPSVQAAFAAAVQQRLGSTVWASGCRSWYLDAQGRNTTLWPGSTWTFRRQVKAAASTDFIFDAENAPPAPTIPVPAGGAAR